MDVGRLMALGASTLAAASSLALMHAAAWLPLEDESAGTPAAERSPRRGARPGIRATREAPLVALSRVHVGVRVNGFAHFVDSEARDQASTVMVLLDSGSSLALATVDGQEHFGLEVGFDPPLPSHGFSGHPSKLFVLARSQELLLSLDGRSEPHAVAFPIVHLSPNRLHGAHVIAPPHLLAPAGGAVKLDFQKARFTACESADECRAEGGPWVPLSVRTCDDRPELIVVDILIDGTTETMMLDTGAATLFFKDAFGRLGLLDDVVSSQTGSLLGAGSAEVAAERVMGDFAISLGARGAVPRHARSSWVVPVPPERRPAQCATAGSVGADLLGDCRIVIADGVPLRGFLSCSGDESSAGARR